MVYCNLLNTSAILVLFNYLFVFINQFDEDKMGSIDFPEFIDLLVYLERKRRAVDDDAEIRLGRGVNKK
jgi:hypothetical protein